jgi:2-polyprenyl-3-methyl-5-hydroxy-6-metoxy-1,4-benzoquinol methylase
MVIKSNLEQHCPLCEGATQHMEGFYIQCSSCDLVFKDSHQLLNQKEEKARYDLHNNDLNDENYIKYLNRMIEIVRKNVRNDYFHEAKNILDYGCGPVKGYEFLLKNQKGSHYINSYDPYYFLEKAVLKESYDLIIASETAEHFNHPKIEIENWNQCLNQNGILAIRTELFDKTKDLNKWWYAKDPTHVVFYTLKTWEWFAHNCCYEILHMESPFIILQKK